MLDKKSYVDFIKRIRGVEEGKINIYRHIHNADLKDWYNDSFHVCVSIEKINYIPKKLNDLLNKGIYE